MQLQLEADADFQNRSRVCPSHVENVGCEPNPLVRKADEEAALSVEAVVVRLCSLGHQA